MTPPSIYLHFADKDDLFLAVCDDRFRELDRRSQEVAADATDPLDEIRRRGEAYIRFGLESPEEYRILFLDRQTDSATTEKVAQWACLQHMVEAVERCMEAGMIRAADPAMVTIGLWAVAHGLTSLMISKPGFPWPPVDELIDHVLHTAVVGLA